MNPNWLGIVAAALSLVAFIVCYLLAKKVNLQCRVLLFILAGAAAVPGLGFAVYYAHLFPDAAWYFQFRSLQGTELLVILIGVAGGILAAVLPRLLLILPLLGAILLSVVPFVKPVIGPIRAGTFQDKWDGDVCMQSTPSTCGAASVATVLRSLGVEVSEAELAKEAHSYSGGTEAWYLARAVRKRGCDARFVFSSGFDPDMEWPAVKGVKLGAVGHFIPVLSKDGATFVIGDPLNGRETLTLDELKQRYVFTGFSLLVGK